MSLELLVTGRAINVLAGFMCYGLCACANAAGLLLLPDVRHPFSCTCAGRATLNQAELFHSNCRCSGTCAGLPGSTQRLLLLLRVHAATLCPLDERGRRCHLADLHCLRAHRSRCAAW